jgi:hypothetical protein
MRLLIFKGGGTVSGLSVLSFINKLFDPEKIMETLFFYNQNEQNCENESRDEIKYINSYLIN